LSTIIESITGIKIKSAYFINSPILKLFCKNRKKYRVSLLYGKNGSGKSSIAQGFCEYHNCVNSPSIEIIPVLSDGTLLSFII